MNMFLFGNLRLLENMQYSLLHLTTLSNTQKNKSLFNKQRVGLSISRLG